MATLNLEKRRFTFGDAYCKLDREVNMGRGPSYPYVNLEDAVGLARKMYDYSKRGSAPVESVIKDAWKYSPTSSSGQKVLAALRAFGLLEDGQASGGTPTIKLSQRAIHILLEDQDTPERREELKKAALSPKWYEFCWKTWGKEMPPAMKSNLLIHHGFVDSTIEGFLRDYRKSIAYAGLLDQVIFSDGESSHTQDSNEVRIGDYVQWEINGVLQLPTPKKLERIEQDFAFLEGSLTGIPQSQLIPSAPPDEIAGTDRQLYSHGLKPAYKASIGFQVETFALPEGVTGQIQWPTTLSGEAYEDFIYQLEGLKRRVFRAVPKESTNPA